MSQTLELFIYRHSRIFIIFVVFPSAPLFSCSSDICTSCTFLCQQLATLGSHFLKWHPYVYIWGRETDRSSFGPSYIKFDDPKNALIENVSSMWSEVELFPTICAHKMMLFLGEVLIAIKDQGDICRTCGKSINDSLAEALILHKRMEQQVNRPLS